MGVGIDRFVASHFSIGLSAGAAYGDDLGYRVSTLEETKSYSLSGGFRLGYDFSLNDRFSWYPRITLGISSKHAETTSFAGASGVTGAEVSSSIGPFVDVYAPLLVHLVPHVFVGFGPRVVHDFSRQGGGPYAGTQPTVFGGELALGGWWGEGGAGVNSEPNAETPSDGPFGERGQVALGLATNASILHRLNSASTYSETAADLNPSLDYFVSDNFSIGVDAFINHSSGKSLDADSTPIRFASTGAGVGPRFGSNVPIGSRCSLWPQVELGYGTVSTEQTSSEGTNQHSRSRVWLRLSGPVLFDVTSHFLLGAGPYYFQELSDTDQRGNKNRAQSIGVRLVMVGWFGSRPRGASPD